LPIGTEGTPPTVAAPAKSLYQSDLVAIRVILDAAWALRAPLISVMTDCAWGGAPAV